jgi:hypothetical protein
LIYRRGLCFEISMRITAFVTIGSEKMVKLEIDVNNREALIKRAKKEREKRLTQQLNYCYLKPTSIYFAVSILFYI